MLLILLDFQFKDLLNWTGGLIIFLLFFVVCYYIGQLGVQIRSGINILLYLRKVEREAKAKGMAINEKGFALKRKGKRKILLSILVVIIFYLLSFTFIPTLKYKLATLFACLPITLGFFGIFLVPEQLEDD